MTNLDPRNRRGDCCMCRQITDQMWQSRTTAFLYCDDCRRAIPRDTLVRVV